MTPLEEVASTAASRAYKSRPRHKQVGSWPLFNSTAALATGAKTALSLGHPHRTFAMQGRLSTGGSTRATVQLQGTIDGTNWVNLGGTYTMAINAAAIVVSTNTAPVLQVRANITSFSTLASTAADVARGGYLYLAAWE